MARLGRAFSISRAPFFLAIIFIPIIVASETTDTTTHCVTRYNYEQPPQITAQSFNTTITNTRTEQQPTQTLSETITPPTQTSMTTEFDIITVTRTQRTNIATFSTTETHIITELSTTISKTTQGDTVTVTKTPTLTWPTSAGFTPIFSEPAVIAAGGGSVIRKRAVRREKIRRKTTPTSDAGLKLVVQGGTFWLSKPQFPSLVKCTKVFAVQTTTTTYLSTTTVIATAAEPTETSTITEQITLTTTLPHLHASATLTFHETITTTSIASAMEITTGTLAVTTHTVAAPQETFFPNCQADNILNAVGGNAVSSFSLRNGLVGAFGASSAYDCCVQCVLTPSCAGTIFGSNSCYLLADKGGYSDPSIDSWSFSTSPSAGSLSFVSNGNCGQGLFIE